MLTPDPGGGFPTRKSPGMYRRLVLYGIIGMAGKLAAPEYTDLGEWRCRDTPCFFLECGFVLLGSNGMTFDQNFSIMP